MSSEEYRIEDIWEAPFITWQVCVFITIKINIPSVNNYAIILIFILK